eukprot:COSAG02_NODE_48296_length_334_cov_2.327660_1_plen_28_part_10
MTMTISFRLPTDKQMFSIEVNLPGIDLF